MKGNTYCRADLVSAINNEMDKIGVGGEQIVDRVLNELAAAFGQGRTVRFNGFGTFKPRVTKARIGRNPKTGETHPIPPRWKIGFTFTGELPEVGAPASAPAVVTSDAAGDGGAPGGGAQ